MMSQQGEWVEKRDIGPGANLILKRNYIFIQKKLSLERDCSEKWPTYRNQELRFPHVCHGRDEHSPARHLQTNQKAHALHTELWCVAHAVGQLGFRDPFSFSTVVCSGKSGRLPQDSGANTVWSKLVAVPHSLASAGFRQGVCNSSGH